MVCTFTPRILPQQSLGTLPTALHQTKTENKSCLSPPAKPASPGRPSWSTSAPQRPGQAAGAASCGSGYQGHSGTPSVPKTAQCFTVESSQEATRDQISLRALIFLFRIRSPLRCNEGSAVFKKLSVCSGCVARRVLLLLTCRELPALLLFPQSWGRQLPSEQTHACYKSNSFSPCP